MGRQPTQGRSSRLLIGTEAEEEKCCQRVREVWRKEV
jgi:hypothetical protein